MRFFFVKQHNNWTYTQYREGRISSWNLNSASEYSYSYQLDSTTYMTNFSSMF